MNYHKKANITLTAVFLIFLGSAVLEHFYASSVGVRLLFFVSEAALVGGIADWFAVTAIFRKPLGWGYHTALIPRNREKVIEAVASIVQKELLHLDIIRKKILGISFATTLFQFVEKEGGAPYLTELICRLIRRFAQKQEPIVLTEKLTMFLRSHASNWYLTPKVQELAQWAATHGYLDQGVDLLADGLWDKAAGGDTHKLIVRYLEEIKEEKVMSGGSIFKTLMGLVEMSDGLNIDEAADALQVELLLILRKLKDPKQPLRESLMEILLKTISELGQNDMFSKEVECWKEELLREKWLEKLLEHIIKEILETLSSPTTQAGPNHLQQVIGQYVEKYWVFVQKTEIQEKINSFIVDTLIKVIQNEHNLIGGMVRETLASYNDQDLNQFVEEKAGNDLQWIRINGSMIGGVVGLILFSFLNFVYDPIIMPAIMKVIAR